MADELGRVPQPPAQEADRVLMVAQPSSYDQAPASDARTPSSEARISLRLTPEARAAVEKIMQLGNMDTMQEAIRRAIGEELFLMTERRAGWKVLLQKGDRYREVVFPQI